MLTIERPGVFVGRSHNADGWYVVDTAWASDEKRIVAQWRQSHAKTNQSTVVSSGIRFGVPILCFVVAFVLLSAVPTLDHLVVLILAVVASYILRFVIVFLLAVRPQNVVPEMAEVRRIDKRVLAWATDETTWPAIWALNEAFASDDPDALKEAEWTGYRAD